jgi:hypothetical protein
MSGGHGLAADVQHLLRECPAIACITVAGMLMGSSEMEGPA